MICVLNQSVGAYAGHSRHDQLGEIGILVGLAAAQWIQPLPFQQSTRDPVTDGAVAALLGIVAVLASAAPPRRATRADPNTTWDGQPGPSFEWPDGVTHSVS